MAVYQTHGHPGIYGREQLGKPLVDEVMAISALRQCQGMHQTPELFTLLEYRFAISICISREIDLGSSTTMSPEPASSLFCMPDSAMGPRVCRGSALIRQLGNKTSFFWARHGQSKTSTGAHATQDRAAWSALAPEQTNCAVPSRWQGPCAPCAEGDMELASPLCIVHTRRHRNHSWLFAADGPLSGSGHTSGDRYPSDWEVEAATSAVPMTCGTLPIRSRHTGVSNKIGSPKDEIGGLQVAGHSIV